MVLKFISNRFEIFALPNPFTFDFQFLPAKVFVNYMNFWYLLSIYIILYNLINHFSKWSYKEICNYKCTIRHTLEMSTYGRLKNTCCIFPYKISNGLRNYRWQQQMEESPCYKSNQQCLDCWTLLWGTQPVPSTPKWFPSSSFQKI